MSIQLITPNDDPNSGRVKINSNFNYLNNVNLTGSGISNITNGINIFTASTSASTISLNLTGASLNNLFVSGNNTSNSFSSTTLTATSLALGYQILTDQENISWDLSQGNIAEVTLGDNRNMSFPNNLRTGHFTLMVKQDMTGGRGLDFNSGYTFSDGAQPLIATGASNINIFKFISDGSNMYGLENYNIQ